MAAQSRRTGGIPRTMPRVKRGKTWRFWVDDVLEPGSGYGTDQVIYVGVPRCDLPWQGKITSTTPEGDIEDTVQINYGYAPFPVDREDIPCTGGTGEGATFNVVSELQP